ncbi:MAG: hypothetical protein ACYC8T_13065, partial [Myxococcaceae bacterium]
LAKGGQTPMNIQLGRIIVFTMLVQAAGSAAYFWLVGDLGPLIIPLNSAYWFVVSGVITVSIMHETWPTALGYLGCLMASLHWPEQRYFFVAAANSVFCANAVYIRFRLKRPKGETPNRGS